jgi:type I restriction enzyme M protein
VPPTSKGDYAFISHMIETTFIEPSQRGRVGVVVPHGVLFRGGAEGRIRQQLIDENLLDAVIGLPENLFYGTGIPAAILIFRRDRSDDRVLFIDASQDYREGTNQNVLRAEDLQKIMASYRQRETIAKYAYLATRAEIAENDYNLNIPRYVDTFEQEEQIDIAVVNAEIAALRGQLGALEGQMQAYLKELGLECINE